MITIAIDAMGGDHGYHVTLPAAEKALALDEDLQIILVGDESILSKKVANSDRLSIKPSLEVVTMDESPTQALRNKRNSSMRLAIEAVKSGDAQACVSAGNTGALMAMARYSLRMIEGIDRPAIISAIPTLKGSVYMLDLGANVDCTADHLLQFSLMGSVLAEVVGAKKQPRLALLSNGLEVIKGNDLVKLTAKLLSNHPSINFIGYVEGDDIYSGKADVIVCDGFVGNVALKASEGVSKFIRYHLEEAFKANYFNRFLALLAKPALRRFSSRVDPKRYNGANLLGLQGIVIKSHGSANVEAFSNAIICAKHEAERDLINELSLRIQPMMNMDT